MGDCMTRITLLALTITLGILGYQIAVELEHRYAMEDRT